MQRLLIFTIVFSLILFSTVFSQNYAGKIGLIFATNSSTSYSNIGFSYWLLRNLDIYMLAVSSRIIQSPMFIHIYRYVERLN